jgi:hypothetical protein
VVVVNKAVMVVKVAEAMAEEATAVKVSLTRSHMSFTR